MTVQTGDGPLTIGAGDLQFSYRGKTIAIKVRALSWPVIAGCIRLADGSWTADAELYGEWANDAVTPESDLIKYGGAMGFVRTVLLPAVNEWLARLFPASGTPLTALEQIDAAIQGIRFTPQADGTLRAELS